MEPMAVASSAVHRRLVRTLYRGCLSAARRLARDADGRNAGAAAPHSTGPSGRPRARSDEEAPALVRKAFRLPLCATVPLPRRVDAAFSALRMLNARAEAVGSESYQPKPASVRHRVGTVFRHRLYAYRAVIIGWDATCAASEQWVDTNSVHTLPHGTAQPFYHCLVDVRDRPEAQVSYVAQDNVQLLDAAAVDGSGSAARATATATDSSSSSGNSDSSSSSTAAHSSAEALAERVVLHPLLGRYFSHFNPDTGDFTPVPAVEQLYPDDSAVALQAATLAAHLADGAGTAADAALDTLASLTALGGGSTEVAAGSSMQLR